MDKETDELYNLVKESDATDLGVLISAKESAKRRLLDESTAANQEAFHKASRYLKEYLRGDEKPAVVYPNKLAALKELQRRGFKIGKSKFYNHCKAGICKTQNKKITEEALEAYIRDPRANLKDIDSKEGERVAREKAEAERDRAQLQVKMLQHELEVKQKEFLPRSEVHREWCGRWYAVKMGVENMVEAKRAEWVFSILGAYDSEAARRLGAAVLEGFSAYFDDFARMKEYEVEFT